MINRLKLWTRPKYYIGATWEDYYALLAQHRDSGVLDRSNFIAALKALGGESDTVIVERSSHWAVGWCETILIHQSDSKAVEIGNRLMSSLEGYPILDEDLYSTMEWNESVERWERASVRERLGLLQRAGLCVFSARSAEIPEDPQGRLWELIRPE